VRVQHDGLVRRALDHASSVHCLQVAGGLRLQIDLDTQLVLHAGLRRAIEDRFEEQAVTLADVEAGLPQSLKSRDSSLRQADQVEHTDCAALHQLIGARAEGAALDSMCPCGTISWTTMTIGNIKAVLRLT
jgi:hypothetical protein